jgi:hypothetical protein
MAEPKPRKYTGMMKREAKYTIEIHPAKFDERGIPPWGLP